MKKSKLQKSMVKLQKAMVEKENFVNGYYFKVCFKDMQDKKVLSTLIVAKDIVDAGKLAKEIQLDAFPYKIVSIKKDLDKVLLVDKKLMK